MGRDSNGSTAKGQQAHDSNGSTTAKGQQARVAAAPDVVDPTTAPCPLCCGRLESAAELTVVCRGDHAFAVHIKCWGAHKNKYLSNLNKRNAAHKAFISNYPKCCLAKGCALAVCTERDIDAAAPATSAAASAAPLSSEARAAEALLKLKGFDSARAAEFGAKAAALAAKLRVSLDAAVSAICTTKGDEALAENRLKKALNTTGHIGGAQHRGGVSGGGNEERLAQSRIRGQLLQRDKK